MATTDICPLCGYVGCICHDPITDEELDLFSEDFNKIKRPGTKTSFSDYAKSRLIKKRMKK